MIDRAQLAKGKINQTTKKRERKTDDRYPTLMIVQKEEKKLKNDKSTTSRNKS